MTVGLAEGPTADQSLRNLLLPEEHVKITAFDNTTRQGDYRHSNGGEVEISPPAGGG